MRPADEVAPLKLFAVTAFEYLADIANPPELGQQLRGTVDNIRQATSPEVLEQVVRDLVEWTRVLPPERVTELEARLAQANAPSLALMLDRAGRGPE